MDPMVRGFDLQEDWHDLTSKPGYEYDMMQFKTFYQIMLDLWFKDGMWVYSKHKSLHTESIRKMVQTLGRLNVFHDQLERLSIQRKQKQEEVINQLFEQHPNFIIWFYQFCHKDFAIGSTLLKTIQSYQLTFKDTAGVLSPTSNLDPGRRLLSCCVGRCSGLSMLVGGDDRFIQHNSLSLSHFPSISPCVLGSSQPKHANNTFV